MKLRILLIPLLLTACGQSSQIENAVRNRLKDPDSVKFKDVVISEKGDRACIVWNAKNSLGGYGSWEVAELQKNASDWTIVDMDGSELNCTPSGFKALDAIAKAEYEAPQRVLEILAKSTGQKFANIEDYTKLEGHRGCSRLAKEYVRKSGGLANHTARGDAIGMELYKAQVACYEKAFSIGDCDLYQLRCYQPEAAKAVLQSESSSAGK